MYIYHLLTYSSVVLDFELKSKQAIDDQRHISPCCVGHTQGSRVFTPPALASSTGFVVYFLRPKKKVLFLQ